MRTDVGDVGLPGLVGLGCRELPLQVVGRDHSRLNTSHTRSAPVACVRAQPFEFEQSCPVVIAAALAQIAHVRKRTVIPPLRAAA